MAVRHSSLELGGAATHTARLTLAVTAKEKGTRPLVVAAVAVVTTTSLETASLPAYRGALRPQLL